MLECRAVEPTDVSFVRHIPFDDGGTVAPPWASLGEAPAALEDLEAVRSEVAFLERGPVDFGGDRAAVVLRLQRAWRRRLRRRSAGPPAAPVPALAPAAAVSLGLTRRNGARCPWHLSGRCRYAHDEDRGALPPSVLERRFLPAGEARAGDQELIAPWARYVRARHLIVEDPIPCDHFEARRVLRLCRPV